jgi:4-amino-4-deoxy-L-arabinose transferase-like glycosyltransferase
MAPDAVARRRLTPEFGALLFILVAAAALRIYGLKWGLPGSLHAYSYHPDEFLTVNAAFGRVYVGHSLDPGIYTYPSLFIYLSALAMAVGFGYGAGPELASVYFAARVVTVLMGIGAVAVTWWAGRVLFRREVGLVAALILGIAPLHAQHSHFATVDVPSTFFVAATLGLAGLVMVRGSWRDYALAGVTAGLAAGTKYNAGLVLVAPIAAGLLRSDAEKRRWKPAMLAAMVACAAAAFVLSTPGSVINTGHFLGGLLYEVRHAAAGHGLVFAGTGNGFIYTFASSLWHGLGAPLAVLFVVSVAWAMIRRDRPAIILLAFVAPYYILISLSQVRFARYALPLYPAVSIIVAWAALDIYDRLRRARPGKWPGLAWVLVCVAVVAATLCYTIALDSLFGRPDPRDQAARWILAHVPMGSRIGVVDVPWFYSVPLSKTLGYGTLQQREEAAFDAPYDFVVFLRCYERGGWWTEGTPPRWVVLSSYETEDVLRLRNARGLTAEQREEVERILSDLDLVRRHYRPIAEYGGPPRYCVGGASLPHDMNYVSPRIRIMELRG